MYKDISFWLDGKECKCGDYVKLTCFEDEKIGGNRNAKYVGCDLNGDEKYVFVIVAPDTSYDGMELRIGHAMLRFYIKEVAIKNYAEMSIKTENKQEEDEELIDPKYIDGIMEAWACYIFAMLFSTILVFPSNFGGWIISSVVFFKWRHNKIHRG